MCVFADTTEFEVEIIDVDLAKITVRGNGDRYRILELGDLPPGNYKLRIKALPGAKKTYFEVFVGRSLRAQLEIQANAERQGAAAWRGIKAQQTESDVKLELEACAALEEATADVLDALLRDPARKIPE